MKKIGLLTFILTLVLSLCLVLGVTAAFAAEPCCEPCAPCGPCEPGEEPGAVGPGEEPGGPVVTEGPGTAVDITASAQAVLSGDNITLTIREQNTGNVDLTDPYVELTSDPAGVASDTLDSSTASGDNGDNVLNTGETWTWTVDNVTITENTTFTVVGHGMANGTDITYPPYEDETDEVTVTVGEEVVEELSTDVSITANVSSVAAGDTVTLTITETNDGNEDLEGVAVTVTADPTMAGLPATLDDSNLLSGDDGDSILNVGETWEWEITVGPLAENTTFTASGIGQGVDSGTRVDATTDPDEEASVDVEVAEPLQPNTVVRITANPTQVRLMGTVTLTIEEYNNGGEDLENVRVDVYRNVPRQGSQLIATLDDSNLLSGDDGDIILNPGETWTWELSNVQVSGRPGTSVEFRAEGYGEGVDTGTIVDVADYPGEEDTTTVVVVWILLAVFGGFAAAAIPVLILRHKMQR